MSILERLRRLIASNINALFESLVDPGAAIDELIGNMEAAAREARQRVKEALTEDRRMAHKLDALTRSMEEWKAREARAKKAGDEHLAREAADRHSGLAAERAETEQARATGRQELDELGRGLRELDAKLGAVKARRETLKEVLRARARQDGGAPARYDRIVSDVETREAEVQLDAELGERRAADARVEARIAELEREREVDARLAALKDKLGKK